MRAALCFLLALGLHGETILETGFGDAYTRAASNPRATGELPGRWRDNSSWAQVWTAYSRQEEAGRPYFRIEVKRIDDGKGQVVHALPRWSTAGYMRLRLTMRATRGLSAAFGIRRNSAPYTFLWQTVCFPAAEWQDRTFYARIGRADYDIGFYMLVHGAGALDLARFRLDRLSEAELAAELRREAPSHPRNLLRNTRFPLGLQSGWSLDRESSDGDDVTVAPDAGVRGPSGAPALHIRTARAAQIYSEPFPVPRPAEPYTASLWVRGRGAFRLAVMSAGRALARTEAAPSGEWRRARVTFTPPLLEPAAALRLEAEGEIWVDAAQVETGREATPYASAGSCEVALSANSPTRVQFEDEPAEVRYQATGECAVLRARVVNLYGDEAALPAVDLQRAASGTLAYGVFPRRPYGAFRIEVWAEDRTGKRISPFNELVVYRLRRPRFWMRDAPDSPFGVHTNSTTRHILMAKAIGANWTRLHDAGLQYIGWYWLERKPGQWTFFDADIRRYRAYGMKVLGLLSTAPEWASYFEKPHNGYFDRFYQPRDLKQYAAYVRTVVKRYRGVIDAWDVWNEPWNAGWWGVGYDEKKQVYLTSERPQADFARLQRTAYEAAKSVDPSVTVLGINTNAGANGARWTRGVVEAGGLDACDVICYHQYTSGAVGEPGDSVETGRRLGLAPALEGRAPKPVWLTEGSPVNGPGVLGTGFYRHTADAGGEDYFHTADRLARYLTSHLAAGNRKIFLYSMHSQTYFSGPPSQWRVLVTPEGYLHPTAAAHSALAWVLEGARYLRRTALAEGVTAYLFAGNGWAAAVIAPAGRHAPYALPAGALDLFGNPLPQNAPLGSTVAYLRTRGTAEELERHLQGAGAKETIAFTPFFE